MARIRNLGTLQELAVLRRQDPGCGGEQPLLVASRVNQQGLIAVDGCDLVDHRGQVQVLIRDVNRQDSRRLQMAEVERKSLRSEQVNWNRVAGKGIDNQDIESLGRLAFER